MANIIRVGLPVLAVIGCGLAFVVVKQSLRSSPAQPPLIEPAVNPYRAAVSGSGIVEARGENIAVAPALAGIVTQIYVDWGQKVHAGDKLFQIDSGPMAAQITAQEAQVRSEQALVQEAAANLAKLKAEPRAEDVAIFRARRDQAQAQFAYAQSQWERVVKIRDSGSGALSQDDVSARKFALDQSTAGVAAAQADLDKTVAGAWSRDIAIAEASLAVANENLAAAEARLAPLKVDLARLTVSAPVDATVLRINLRRGEYASAAGVGTGSASDGAIVLGDIDHLHVRVDIDENDVPRFIAGAPAIGFVRGKTDLPINLKFVRIEPFVIPKRNLTGASAERVDTRVLQIIYAADNPKIQLFVGQQLDVFIQSERMAALAEPLPKSQP